MKAIAKMICFCALVVPVIEPAQAQQAQDVLDQRLFDIFRRIYVRTGSSVGYYQSDAKGVLSLKDKWKDSFDLPLPSQILMSELKGPDSDGKVTEASEWVVILRVSAIDGMTEMVGLGVEANEVRFLHIPKLGSSADQKIKVSVIRERLKR